MEQYACPYETAVTYILLEDFEKAFEYLDDAVNARSNCLVFTRNDIRLTPIRSDPRYQALLIRVGLDDESLSKNPR